MKYSLQADDLVDPVWLVNWPDGHDVQISLPGAALYVAWGHFSHAFPPEWANCPAGQTGMENFKRILWDWQFQNCIHFNMGTLYFKTFKFLFFLLNKIDLFIKIHCNNYETHNPVLTN